LPVIECRETWNLCNSAPNLAPRTRARNWCLISSIKLLYWKLVILYSQCSLFKRKIGELFAHTLALCNCSDWNVQVSSSQRTIQSDGQPLSRIRSELPPAKEYFHPGRKLAAVLRVDERSMEGAPVRRAPRLLTREDAAHYCAVSTHQFMRHVAPHVRALRIGNRLRWDIKMLDAFLDVSGGQVVQPPLSISQLLGVPAR